LGKIYFVKKFIPLPWRGLNFDLSVAKNHYFLAVERARRIVLYLLLRKHKEDYPLRRGGI